MQTRQATLDDAGKIARYICMAEGEMAELFTGFSDMEKAAAEILKLVLSPEPCRYSWHNNIVADDEGNVVGSVICFPADDQPKLDKPMLEYLQKRGTVLDKLFFEGVPGTYYLSTMAVDPECRGKGAGKTLMAAAEAQGKAKGYDKASLLVSTDKERARSLYERVGYAVVEEVAIVSHPYYRMVKNI